MNDLGRMINMQVYAIIMAVAALVFLGVGLLVYKGKPHLLFQVGKHVDKGVFGKAVGRPILVLAAVCVLSAAVALIGGESTASIYATVSVFVAGFLACFVWMEVIKKRHKVK